jgi:hypothetical protein
VTGIHLGFEVGTGEIVEIPLLNLAVTGQTQQSGKTTTLEALVSRSGVRALTFVTKRGESAFTDARRIQPYFRDRADWQFVTSIIDATLQEKNKFLRSWIMKICRTTRTLEEVQAAVRHALKTAKGINEGVYTQLDAYLDLIVPEIRRTPLAPTLELGPGLNVMDVSASPTPMQMLFIQSAIDWVNEHESNTIVVIPEAWEFVPEGKSSPVKASATTLVRKGSGIGNHVWLDSQDMAGVDKVLLRGCPVFLIGVQREANEIKRTLSNIPASIKKPTAAAVATLERGQFYACWGNHAIKTYVQPAWMSGEDAQYVARGFAVDPSRLKRPAQPKESTVSPEEERRLRQENADLKRRVEELERFIDQPKVGDSIEITRGAAKLATVARPAADVELPHPPLNGDSEAIYQFVKQRLATDAPALLRVVTIRPEMEVQVQRRTVTMDGSSTRGRLAKLVSLGFLNDTRRFSECLREIERTGPRVNNKSLAMAFKELVAAGFLTKEGEDGYRAVADMKVRIVEV